MLRRCLLLLRWCYSVVFRDSEFVPRGTNLGICKRRAAALNAAGTTGATEICDSTQAALCPVRLPRDHCPDEVSGLGDLGSSQPLRAVRKTACGFAPSCGPRSLVIESRRENQRPIFTTRIVPIGSRGEPPSWQLCPGIAELLACASAAAIRRMAQLARASKSPKWQVRR